MNGYPPGAIWTADDEDSIQIREVYSRYGLAMYQAQVLEHGMVNAIIVARMLPAMEQHLRRKVWEDALDRAYDFEFAKTFGNVIRALEGLSLPRCLIDGLRRAKGERDRLAHSFFREHDQNFLSHSGRKKMIAECEIVIEHLALIDARLDEFMQPHRERHGVTKEGLEKQVAIMIASAKAREG